MAVIKVALIQEGVVSNLLMWDTESSWLPPGYVLVEILEGVHPEALDVGWLYDDATGVFSPPE